MAENEPSDMFHRRELWTVITTFYILLKIFYEDLQGVAIIDRGDRVRLFTRAPGGGRRSDGGVDKLRPLANVLIYYTRVYCVVLLFLLARKYSFAPIGTHFFHNWKVKDG